jgi:predicted PurR-regulated permease PerM
MAARPPIERLRFTPRSLVLAVILLGLTLSLLRIAEASQRVLGWVAVAMAVAGLLHPTVSQLAKRMPRGLAVAVVALGTLAIVGTTSYFVVRDIVDETQELQTSVPNQARKIEQSKRFGETATKAHLADRAERFVKRVPEQLQGGSGADAVRAATTRGVAFLATGVLSLFFLLHGPTLAKSAGEQIPERRAYMRQMAIAAYHRGFAYARGTGAEAIAAGLVAYLVARIGGVPGPAPLGLWVALWDLVPLVGAFVGALPIVLLAGAVHSVTEGIIVAVAFLGYQTFENLVLQRRLERSTLRLGPFLSAAGGFVGLELYGIGGALMALLALALAAAVADELAAPA